MGEAAPPVQAAGRNGSSLPVSALNTHHFLSIPPPEDSKSQERKSLAYVWSHDLPLVEGLGEGSWLTVSDHREWGRGVSTMALKQRWERCQEQPQMSSLAGKSKEKRTVDSKGVRGPAGNLGKTRKQGEMNKQEESMDVRTWYREEKPDFRKRKSSFCLRSRSQTISEKCWEVGREKRKW